MEQKADVSITTSSGDSVLHAGVYGNNATIVDHLIVAGKFTKFREYLRSYPEFPWNIPLPAISVQVQVTLHGWKFMGSRKNFEGSRI